MSLDHDADHGRRHVFGQDLRKSGEGKTIIVIAIAGLMMVAEITTGLLFGSMAPNGRNSPSVQTLALEDFRRGRTARFGWVSMTAWPGLMASPGPNTGPGRGCRRIGRNSAVS